MATPADPASLDRLVDIVVPPPVPWWPPAPGWLVLGGVVLVLVAWAAWRGWMRWRAAAYRRAALVEWRRLRAAAADPAARATAVAALPILLKRTALAAFPRETVASASGGPWLAFLDRTGRTDAFTQGPGKVLADVAYDPRVPAALDAAAVEALFGVAERWIAGHARDAAC